MLEVPCSPVRTGALSYEEVVQMGITGVDPDEIKTIWVEILDDPCDFA